MRYLDFLHLQISRAIYMLSDTIEGQDLVVYSILHSPGLIPDGIFGLQGGFESYVEVDSMILAYCDESGAPVPVDKHIWSSHGHIDEIPFAREFLFYHLATRLVG